MALPILFSKGTSSSRWLTDLDDDAKFHLLIAICDTGLNPPFISCGPSLDILLFTNSTHPEASSYHFLH
jgi:hypothetical protein